MNTLVTATGIQHHYGKTRALDTLNLTLEAGRSVAFIGPDGVGKSTLLGLIAGAKRLQQGNLTIFGGDVRHPATRRQLQQRVAYMPQGLGKNLYPELSIRENLDFFGRLYEHGKAEREKRIHSLLTATGLAPFIDRPAGKLSGGMKQKLSLCCALIHDPELLILDEPTTGVDPLSRRQFWQLIDRIRQQQPQLTVLVATSYMEEAEQFDTVIMMDDGKVIAQGSATSLKEQSGEQELEAAFIAFLPAEKRAHHILPRSEKRDLSGQPTAIEARGLTKRFGAFVAVDNVNFTIPTGEIYGFLGSNGCGKTTTMKMLTGLLPASEGASSLFGQPLVAGDIENRRRIGYMSQAFSLYGELTVHQNLTLHAKLFGIDGERASKRLAWLYDMFDLHSYKHANSGALPLGVRQRLSLAVAVIHEPEILILDEPTSGVDPVARDNFWALLIELAHQHHVTIFISTHFMNEAARCDRISLMHAGRVIATGTPEALRQQKQAATLDEAFVSFLEDAAASEAGEEASSDTTLLNITTEEAAPDNTVAAAPAATLFPPEESITGQKAASVNTPALSASAHEQQLPHRWFSAQRMLAYMYRELLELQRDPIRLGMATLGMAMLMLVFGYGIALDVDSLRYAALDRDQSPESRLYLEGFSGSPYFDEQPPLFSHAELMERMQRGQISLALEIPPDFGRHLRRGNTTEIAATIDGAMPFRAETIGGYTQALHRQFLQQQHLLPATPLVIESRYRYNQSFESINAMVPSVIGLMLIFIPSILAALSVVREKEMGSISNLYVTPVSRAEFILGKQIPYIGLSMVGFGIMFVLAVLVFGVSLKGSFIGLALGALVYVIATTGLGMLISSFTRSQIAALFGTAILTMMPASQFSGMLRPVATLEGGAYWLGTLYPTTYFLKTSVGAFTKGLDFASLLPFIGTLALFAPALLALNIIALKKQET